MSNLARKIEKRNEKINIEIMKTMPVIMTQEEYHNRIKEVDENYKKQYQDKLHRMAKEMEEEIHQQTISVINTISVELLYELAEQMGVFEEGCEHYDDIKYRVQEIYTNTMEAIKKYNKYKRPMREFNKRKSKIEKMFDIKF